MARKTTKKAAEKPATSAAPAPHKASRGYGVTGKFPTPKGGSK